MNVYFFKRRGSCSLSLSQGKSYLKERGHNNVPDPVKESYDNYFLSWTHLDDLTLQWILYYAWHSFSESASNIIKNLCWMFMDVWYTLFHCSLHYQNWIEGGFPGMYAYSRKKGKPSTLSPVVEWNIKYQYRSFVIVKWKLPSKRSCEKYLDRFCTLSWAHNRIVNLSSETWWWWRFSPVRMAEVPRCCLGGDQSHMRHSTSHPELFLLGF